MSEAFEVLAEQKSQVDRLIAADLPGESFFTIKWKMISDIIDLGRKCQTAREAGNVIELLTEELPGMMNYAEVHAGGVPDANADGIIRQLEEMLETCQARARRRCLSGHGHGHAQAASSSSASLTHEPLSREGTGCQTPRH